MFTKKIEHTSNIPNDTTRHNHNNYDHDVIKKLRNKHIEHTNDYDTETNHDNKKPLSKKNYLNLYHYTFNLKEIE